MNVSAIWKCFCLFIDYSYNDGGAANKLLGRGVGLDGRKKMIKASISKINHWVLFKQLTASRVPVYW